MESTVQFSLPEQLEFYRLRGLRKVRALMRYIFDYFFLFTSCLYIIDISPPGGYQNPDASTGGQQSIVTTSTETATKTTSPSQSTTHRPTATTTTSSIGPTQTGVVKGCHKFYTVQSGESCDNIESRFGISFGEFHKWNPTGMSLTFLLLLSASQKCGMCADNRPLTV